MKQLLLIVVLLFLGACNRDDWSDAELARVPEGSATVVDLIWADLENAESVRAYLLDQNVGGTERGHRAIGSRRAVEPGPELTADQREQLITSLRRTAEGDCGPMKRCFPSPYVGIRFLKNDTAVDFAICFECSIWIVTRNYVSVSGFDKNFDCERDRIVALAQALFPEDSALQSLARRSKR